MHPFEELIGDEEDLIKNACGVKLVKASPNCDSRTKARLFLNLGVQSPECRRTTEDDTEQDQERHHYATPICVKHGTPQAVCLNSESHILCQSRSGNGYLAKPGVGVEKLAFRLKWPKFGG